MSQPLLPTMTIQSCVDESVRNVGRSTNRKSRLQENMKDIRENSANPSGFEAFPEYDYSKSERERFKFYYGEAKKFRTLLTEADKESEPNKISLIYCWGFTKQNIQTYIDKTGGNICLLHCEIPKEWMEVYEAYKDCEKWFSSGFSGNTTDERAANCKQRLAHYQEVALWSMDVETKESVDRIASEWRPHIDEYDRYKQLEPKIKAAFERYTVYLRGEEAKPGSLHRLWKIVRYFFPDGQEQLPLDKKLYGTLKCGEYAERGFAGVEVVNGMNSTQKETMQRILKFGMRYVRDNIQEHGYCSLLDLWRLYVQKPYGLMENAFGAWVMGKVASDYGSTEFYAMDSIGSVFPISKNIVAHTLYQAKARRPNTVYICKEYHKMGINALQYIFGIDSRQSFANAMIHVCSKTVMRSPISLRYPELNQMFLENMNLKDKNSGSESADWLVTHKREIKKYIQAADSKVAAKISEMYPQLDSMEVLMKSTTVASWWLWSESDFWRSVIYTAENMLNGNEVKRMICKECNSHIRDKEYNGSKVIVRDIVGLNKKLVDENASRFYCFDCMTELFECDPEDMIEKIRQFKEDGCKLFG